MSIFSNLSPEEEARKEAEEATFKALPLIEQNRIKLVELEQEWSVLGSKREITFTVFFGEADEAKTLASVAEEKGFNTNIKNGVGERHNCELKATRLMEPKAETVTFWEEWFRNYASQVPDFDNGEYYDREYQDAGANFKGWNYPKRLSPSFFLKGNTKSREHQNAIGARERTCVLFGQNLCNFEASNGWYSKKNISKPSPSFELIPSEFIQNARLRRPSNPEPTASAFSQWLYSLYSNQFGTDQDRAEGKAAEEYIFKERQNAYVTTDYMTMRESFSDWRLKHNGLSFNQSDKPNYYSIKELLVKGQSLRVLPDLIYENIRTREIIIVEVKYSQMDIPSNLWPNIWGQLWCYAQIQEIRDCPKVTVIGEVWGDRYHSLGRGMHREQWQYIYLRASIRRNPRAIAYDRFFRKLFDIYRDVE